MNNAYWGNDKVVEMSNILLNEIVNDWRLERLFSNRSKSCALQLWIMNIKQKDYESNRILYGRLVPYCYSDNAWYASSSDHCMKVECKNNKITVNIIRMSCYLDSALCKDFIVRMAEGVSLADISIQLGLRMDDKIKRELQMICFGKNGGVVSRPIACLLNRDSLSQDEITSPYGGAGAFSAAIVQLDKSDLLRINEKYDPKVIRWIFERIYQDSGLDFNKSDRKRLGELELLCFPTIDDYEKNLLNLERKEDGSVEVVFSSKQLKWADNFLFHLILKNDGLTVYSKILEADKPRKDCYYCSFKVEEYLARIIDCAELEIFGIKKDLKRQKYLCCRYKIYYLREINISVNLINNSSQKVRFNWLEWSLPRSAVNKAASLLEVNQKRQKKPSVVGGRVSDSWVKANRNLGEILDRNCPVKSDACFFQKLSQSDRKGRLLFVEWFKSLLSKYPGSKISIFDHYFDDVGLGLLSFCATPEISCTIFRAEKRGEKENRQIVREGEENDSLYYTKLPGLGNKEMLLSRFNLRIFEVKTGLLHDRYILIKSKDNELLAGFHLSNSFQYLCKNHPLLITPIPQDVLIEVDKYQRELEILSETANEGENLLKKVFEFPRRKKTIERNSDPWAFLEGRLANLALSIWFGEPELRDTTVDNLKRFLLNSSYVENFEFKYCVSEGLNRCQGVIKDFKDDFRFVWRVLAEIIGRSHIEDNKFECVNADGDFVKYLLEFVRESVESGIVEVKDGIEVLDCSYFEKDEISLWNINLNLEYLGVGNRMKCVSFAEYFAIRILWEKSPLELLKIIEDQVDYLLECERNECEDGNYILRRVIISQVVSVIVFSIVIVGTDKKQRLALLQSQVGLFQWLGVNAIEKTICDSKQLSLINEISSVFDKNKMMCVWIWLIKRRVHDVRRRELFKEMVKKFLNFLPKSIDEVSFKMMVTVLSGGGDLCQLDKWIYNEILLPLLIESRLTCDQVSTMWMREVLDLLGVVRKNVSFSITAQGEMVNMAAFFFVNSSEVFRKECMDRIRSVFDIQLKELRRPLVEVPNYSRRDNAINKLILILCLCLLIEYYQEVAKPSDEKCLGLILQAKDAIQLRLNVKDWKRTYPDIMAFLERVEQLK